MNAEQLETRLRLGEDSAHEFKSVARNGFKIHAPDIGKEIAAFANSGGGRILLGVEDDGTPTGIGEAKQADALDRQVAQVCMDTLEPALVCRRHKIEARGMVILVVEVPGFAQGRPYSGNGAIYVRDGTISRPARREEQIRLLQSEDHPFDEHTVDGATLDDLDLAQVREFLSRYDDGDEVAASGVEPYLRALECLDAEGCPSVSGVLFFGREPQKWLPDARISALRLPGVEVSLDALDAQEIGGTLTRQIDLAHAFLERHLLSPSRVDGFERRELGLPERVLREALLNALSHRDYRMTAQTRLFVFDDRVELTNPGGLMNRLTVPSIRLGMTQRRNPGIASILAKSMRRESRGVGVPAMFRMMRERGLPEPEILVEGGHFRLTLRLLPPRPA